MTEETPKINPEVLGAVVKGETELKHVTPHAKQDLLSEVRKEAHHIAETLKHTQTVGKQDLLSEVRKESHHVTEGLKKSTTSSKRDLMGEIRKSVTKADVAAAAAAAATGEP